MENSSAFCASGGALARAGGRPLGVGTARAWVRVVGWLRARCAPRSRLHLAQTYWAARSTSRNPGPFCGGQRCQEVCLGPQVGIRVGCGLAVMAPWQRPSVCLPFCARAALPPGGVALRVPLALRFGLRLKALYLCPLSLLALASGVLFSKEAGVRP